MKLLILCLTVLFASCSTSQKCGTWKDVERFDRRPFRAENWPNYERTTLAKIIRTMRGQTHYFITDSGDTIRKFFGKRLEVGQCYLVRKSES